MSSKFEVVLRHLEGPLPTFIVNHYYFKAIGVLPDTDHVPATIYTNCLTAYEKEREIADKITDQTTCLYQFPHPIPPQDETGSIQLAEPLTAVIHKVIPYLITTDPSNKEKIETYSPGSDRLALYLFLDLDTYTLLFAAGLVDTFLNE